MKTGTDTWKWIAVVILLAVFMITANQAYVQVSSQEDYAAPDDYLKGDSWDVEHASGPGAGQPLQMSKDVNTVGGTAVLSDVDVQSKQPLKHEEDMDWTSVEDPFLE